MMLALMAALALQIDLGGGKPAKTEVKLLSVRPDKASVQGSEAFKLAFEIDIPKDWHIYPTTPTSTGSPTRIVSDALEVAGPYEEPKPKTKPKTDVLDAYDYHEGKITIAVPVRVKGGPGKVEVKGILDYQICKDICLIGKTPFAFTVEVQAAAKPEAKLLSVKPEKAGDVAKVAFELEIPKGWYIYPVKPTTTGRPTKLVVEGAELAGPVEEPKPKLKPAAEGNEAYEYHEGTITLVAPLKGLAKEVKGALEYQICDPTTCVLAKTPFSFTVADAPAAPAPREESFLAMLGFAFLGGFILNIMPCVLPVLTIKLIGLVRQKDMTPAARRGAALAYTAGALACLIGFALVVIVLKGALSKTVRWGFQFQEPAFVIGLATLIFVFALSLLGVFTIPAMATGAAAQAGRKHGWQGHLGTGFFVTLVATPCSAPLLGSAMGYALNLPAWGILLFFTTVGFGLAFPFLLIGFVPALIRFMPKPGPWLEVLERLMGFILLAVVVWLADTLGSLTGQRGMSGFLVFLTVVALGAWIFGKWGSEVASGRARIVSLLTAVLLAVVAGRVFLTTELYKATAGPTGVETGTLDFSKGIPWQPFSEENVAAVRKARKPGFIDFTADW